MPNLPKHLMIFPVFVKFTLLEFYVCGVRVQSCLFVLFLLFPIVFLCAISVLSYFWNYDVLDYLACCFGIRLPMFVQHFTITGSNSSFNVSSIEEVVCWEMLQKKRQKLHQLTTKSNERRSPHGGYLIFSIQRSGP